MFGITHLGNGNIFIATTDTASFYKPFMLLKFNFGATSETWLNIMGWDDPSCTEIANGVAGYYSDMIYSFGFYVQGLFFAEIDEPTGIVKATYGSAPIWTAIFSYFQVIGDKLYTSGNWGYSVFITFDTVTKDFAIFGFPNIIPTKINSIVYNPLSHKYVYFLTFRLIIAGLDGISGYLSTVESSE